MKPGPATSTDDGHVVEHAGVDHLLGQFPRVGSHSLGQRQRTVDLCVRSVGWTHRRIGTTALGNDLRPGKIVEDGVQEIGELDDGIRHASASLPDRVERPTDR